MIDQDGSVNIEHTKEASFLPRNTTKKERNPPATDIKESSKTTLWYLSANILLVIVTQNMMMGAHQIGFKKIADKTVPRITKANSVLFANALRTWRSLSNSTIFS